MRRALLSLLAIIAACETSVQPAASVGAGNSCATSNDCARYLQPGALTCVSGRCLASGTTRGIARLQSALYPYTLAISIPDTAIYASSTTLVLSSTSFVLGGPSVPPRNAPCTGEGSTSTCIQVPLLGSSGGLYETNPDTQTAVNWHLNDGSFETTLPVHTAFTLLTSDATTATTQISTGIPVMPTYATVTNQIPFDAPPEGPGATPPIGWTATLPFGKYRRDIVVDPPFNEAFPPWTDVITIPPSPFSAVDLQASATFASANFVAHIDTQANRTINVTSTAVDIQGWTASIVTADDEERLTSSISTFVSPSGGQVILNTVTPPTFPAPGTKGDLTGRQLMIAPPPGIVFPTIAYKAVGGAIVDQTYPAVPRPALVQGTITRQGGGSDASDGATPVSAVLDFVSVDGTLSPALANVPLRYRTSARAGSDGTYSVILPRGDYDVAIEPDPASGLAVYFGSDGGDAGIDGTLHVLEDSVGTSDHAVQAGHGFSLAAPTTVTGRVTITDGRALGGVVVVASPSVGKLAPGVPAKLASLARSRSATADGDGVYTLGLDPGVYDLFAEAPFSSGFAWGIAPARAVVPAGGSNIPVRVDVLVPAPIDASMRLFDPNNDAVRGALVQVFASVNLSDPNSPQIQIGEGRTDASGALELLLPPQLPQ